MRLKAITLLALLTMFAGLTACGEKAAPTATATDLADITLVPYVSEELSIRSVMPKGWAEVKPGQFQRTPGTDPTLLGQVIFPGATIEQVIDHVQLPESVGSRETAGLTWNLYNAELEWPNAGTLAWDVALTEGGAGVYMVVLVALGDEHKPLRDAVFAPAVDALVPVAVTEERAEATPATPPAEGRAPIDTRIRPTDGMAMVYVPAGEFDMGNTGVQWVWGGSLRDGDLDLQVFTDEQPQHTVYLDAFWIDQTEVTVAMFRTFVEATGYETTAEIAGWGQPWREGPMEEEWPQVSGADWLHPRGPESTAEDEHPVVQVSWEDAAAYCEWAGGRLPTEAQWEKAARGTDGRTWPWGNTYDGVRGNFCDAQCPIERWKHDSYDDGYAFTAPVGSFPSGASPYGALDIVGNVWEWVADWYDDSYYGDSPTENPSGPPSGTERAMRGGAWIDNETWVRCTVRYQNPPWSRCDDVGFRCVVPAKEGSP
jgi:formylglycine-generating enzyme required for sulfatase activity